MGQYSTLVMIALMVVAFYFLILRPQKKRQQAVAQTLNALVPGSRVLLGSGLFGTVVSLGERQAVLEISPGVQLTVLKQAIVRTVTDADEDALDDVDDEPADELVEPEAAQGHTVVPGEPVALDSSDPRFDRPTPSAGADPSRLT